MRIRRFGLGRRVTSDVKIEVGQRALGIYLVSVAVCARLPAPTERPAPPTERPAPVDPWVCCLYLFLLLARTVEENDDAAVVDSRALLRRSGPRRSHLTPQT
uniref:Uncharacterized protein n=1 Tax=Plectus sambesii TaxID=2011161 RepID=A0A914VZP9_9BILA